MSDETNNPERERLEDLNIEEAAGRVTPPDLTARILAAAERGAIDDAVTPISGAHSVPRSVRPPAGRRMTAALPRRNWQGAGIVLSAVLLFALALVAFVVWKGPAEKPTGQPATAEQPRDVQPEAPGASPKRSIPEEPQEREPEKQPEPDLEPRVEPKPEEGTPEPERPEEIVEEPKPEPEPRQPEDVVEQPGPETKPAPEPEQPKDTVEQPKPDDKSEVKSTPAPVAVAYVPDGAYSRGAHHYQFRKSPDDEWAKLYSQLKDIPPSNDDKTWLYEGWQLRSGAGDVYLTNGALIQLDGVAGFHTFANGLRIELVEDEMYVDNLATSSTVQVTQGELLVNISDGAALFESRSGKLDIFCVDGQVEVDGKIIAAGYAATLGKRGLSRIREATQRDMDHPLLTGATPRQLGLEEFDSEPVGGFIQGAIETRSATELGTDDAGHVAIDTGRDAAVAFQFDGDHATLRGESVRVRYRATGAKKLILQMFCPARNDNFGIDLEPGKAGEWHVLEIKLSDLRDRVSHRDAPPPGTLLSSFTLALTGQDDAQLEVDWVELVREPRYGE